MTNADKIRAMTDEELALFIHNSREGTTVGKKYRLTCLVMEAVTFDISRADIWVTASSIEAWLEWLKKEVPDNDQR